MESSLLSPDQLTGRRKRPVSLLSPDEQMRFVKEADAAREQFESFDWRDSAGRKWAIRPGMHQSAEAILIQCGRGDTFREIAIPWAEYSAARAETAIYKLDTDKVWA